MFTKEERLFIWKKAYEMIDRLEDGEYICVALRRNGENIFPGIGGKEKYGYRTRRRMEDIWMVWQY